MPPSVAFVMNETIVFLKHFNPGLFLMLVIHAFKTGAYASAKIIPGMSNLYLLIHVEEFSVLCLCEKVTM